MDVMLLLTAFAIGAGASVLGGALGGMIVPALSGMSG